MSEEKFEYPYKIFEKYRYEIEEFDCILRNLEKGNFYENTGCKQDGGLSTNIAKIRKNINILLNKIQRGEPGTDEELYDFYIDEL